MSTSHHHHHLVTIFFLFFLLVLTVTVVMAADLSSDKQALLDFAASVPHSPSKKLNWNSNSNSSSLCTTWSGVTCDSNHLRVVQLRLPAAGFYGSIPPNTLSRLDALSSLSLRSNLLSGPLPLDLLSLPSLRYLYFQDNNFSGAIPSNLSRHLTFLDLSFNSFTGTLPGALTHLTHLLTLNLQNNSLSGPIPDLLLSSSSHLQHLNLTNNNFNGSIPTSLQRFPASSFLGNSLLCGNPLPNQCTNNNSPVSPSPSPAPPFFPQSPSPSTPPLQFSPAPAPAPATSHKAMVKYSKSKLTTGSAVGIAVASSAVLLLLFLLCGILLRRRSRTKKREAIPCSSKTSFGFEQVGRRNGVHENNKLVFLSLSSLDIIINFDLDDLLRASAEVLGKGAYGTTYKAKLQQEGEGTTCTLVAVKRLKQVVVGEMVFQQHMENLGRVNHHPNVLPLRAYYYSKDEKLLVYDYAPFGNLSTLLHGPGTGRTLDWESRLKICVGAARGIAHIHSAAAGRLIHGNIKSSNVLLLTRDLTGCISDFGITPLVGLFTTPSRKTGYQAPEVTELGKYTQKSDVYSFGVILLEILTGKPPIQTPPLVDRAVDLPTWVQSMVREEWTTEVFDTELIKRNRDAQDEMVQTLQVALACASRLPETRPKMEQVVEMIQKILQPQ